MQLGSSLEQEVFFSICKTIDTPTSLGAWLRFSYSEKSLVDMSLNPNDYLTASAFEKDYLAVSFLSKWKGHNFCIDLEEEALRRFTISEDVCRETNIRIRSSRDLPIPGQLASIIHASKRKISDLLGPYSTFKVNDRYGWGPGATSSISRRRALLDVKMCELPISVTRRALPIFREELSHDLHWSSSILKVAVSDIHYPFCFLPTVFSVTEENVIDTVPKNAKTHRVIAKEPTANGFLQKGFGSYFRRRLKSVGIDLDDQGLNQRGAKCASSLSLATIDLKAASDTIAVEVIFELLPVDWALALNDVRSHSGTLPCGNKISYQKFSSMGNAFTFELESLIFWALTSSVNDIVGKADLFVYGDDIIVHQECVPLLLSALEFFGFQVNTEKSFFEGLFFESCGKHYFDGYDVTPIYQKEIVEDEFELLRLGNRLMRLLSTSTLPLSGAWNAVRRRATWSSCYQLPLGTEGDDGWVLPASYFHVEGQDPNLGLRCRVIPTSTVSLPADDRALLAFSLRRNSMRSASFLADFGIPFEGNLSIPKPLKGPPIRSGWRWVMPNGEFGLALD